MDRILSDIVRILSKFLNFGWPECMKIKARSVRIYVKIWM